MEQFDKQFRGYNKAEVDDRIQELKQEIDKQKALIQSMKEEMTDLKEQNTLLTKQISVHEKTNEEIARLALKEASELIEKAKRNANMILKESMEYVRGLSKDMDTFKQEAIDFRTNVVKMSKEMLETIDKSEIFSLIKEEQENKYNDKDSL
ncbi:DivIVA domain-containing protein [Allocoprobacillus halotolerans]|uniref:DivIVA domain-containing protein n=1 Tax=Allocoprobacillus halotolerans TaxID=2944914 RepID=A0ABY5I0P8_9FIRM|nr:DivIVA domain-containing protein [Allocoprobacillus halotolerans]UTY38929.1 DivIVA domain-containing protein [Allocoprobacillus halotolerans]